MPEWAASAERAGVFNVSAETAELFDRVAVARRQADVLVVSAHWGPNWGSEVPDVHRALAHELIGIGVDIVYGHSPHVCRGVEIFNGHPILYSTGAFIDDYAVSPTDRNDHSFIFIVELDGTTLSGIGLVPTVVRDCQVRLAVGQEARSVTNAMIRLCADLGTSARTVENACWPLEIFDCRHGH